MKTLSTLGAIAAIGCSLVTIAAAGCGTSSGGSGFTPGAGGPGGSEADGSAGTGGGFGTGSTDSGSGGGGSLLDAACATATAAASKQPVYMLFVVDGSGSMQQENKWAALVPALDSIFDSIQTSADPSIGLGLIAFSDKNDPTNSKGPYPSKADVSIAYVDATQDSALHTRVDSPDKPGGDTPTKTALTGGFSELEGFIPAGMLQPNGKKVLVLMTDGVPTDGLTSTQGASLVAAELTKTAPAGPITTFVVGIGDFPSNDLTNFDPTFLGALAQAGGASPAGCNPSENTDVTKVCYFEIDPSKAATAAMLSQQFVDAINTIRGEVASCTFTLDKVDGGVVDPSKVNVVYTSGSGTSSIIPQDPTNGWTYDNPADPTSVTLNGTSCAEVKNDAKGSISISIGCPTQGVN